MKKLILFVAFLTSFIAKGQDLDFYCGNQRHSYSYGVWSVPVQSCKGYKSYWTSTNINDIPSKESTIIDSIMHNLKLRAGDELYHKLELYSITISADSNICNDRKYSFRFIYRLDSIFYHRFSLTFNLSGNLISSPQFPDFKTNKNSLDIIDYCTALDIALQNETFKKACNKSGLSVRTPNKISGKMEPLLNISKFNLNYNSTLNIWTWEVYSESSVAKKNWKKHHASGKWAGKKIIINAQTSEIIEISDFYESKIVCY